MSKTLDIVLPPGACIYIYIVIGTRLQGYSVATWLSFQIRQLNRAESFLSVEHCMPRDLFLETF